jgi:hypothetical protein
MLNWEFGRFTEAWLERADGYNDDLNGCYDKFFTLFVVFNRLYSEATFELDKRGIITLPKNRPLPDKKGATEYTLELIGLEKFEEIYAEKLAPHVETVARLIDEEVFYIRFSSPEGERQPERDRELLGELRSSGRTRALAVLELVYRVRCNLFHGHKAFNSVQLELLRPVNVILENTARLLYRRLRDA